MLIPSYFAQLEKQLKRIYEIANGARRRGYDPKPKVEIPCASTIAERVEGLVSAVAPQMVGKGIPKRILELEKKYGSLDWRISLVIAEEIAREKFCKFKSKQEAMEVGLRVGFAYHTLGSVASPIEGFIGLEVRKRQDGKEYIALNYAGPIRSAGGTGASVSVIIGDYLRKRFGYAPYDPTPEEVKRTLTEVYDYHERVTNLQYLPSKEELRVMAEKLPVQIDGPETSNYLVSNYRDLPRVGSNYIRGGFCLVMAECLCQKAPKLLKNLSKWW
ncbi:DNA polymerase II large subunit, partial [Candidatus Woesearchaeota archaeon]|nr:DNA polymerase II large subunit [Candidatus Woesearchaeota archaeon]